MPPGSTDRFLTAPVRPARSSRRHSHSASCQEPVRTIRTIRKIKILPGACQEPIRTIRTIRKIKILSGGLQDLGTPTNC